MNTEHITGFILAGGKSSRMGTDKALLDFQGKPLLAHMLEVIRPVCNRTFVSGDHSDYLAFGVEIISDLYPDKGPVSGILSALEHSETDWNLIVSVDSPNVNEELIRYLISNRKNYESVVPVHQAGSEPLIALYHKNTATVIHEMILSGDYRVMSLFGKVRTKFLACDQLIAKYPRLFLNLNRMEDYLSV